MLACGADLNANGAPGFTALVAASGKDNLEVV
jgi:hypothetical protein